MHDFVLAGLRGHMPEAGILPFALLLVIVGTLALGLWLSARREARALALGRVSSGGDQGLGAGR